MEKALSEVLHLSWPTLVIVLSIVIIMRVTYLLKSEKRSICFHDEIFGLFFLAYLLILFQLVTSQDIGGGGVNLMPFKEILRYDVGTNGFYRQVLGNVCLFIPLGYFATSYCKIKGLGGITLITLLSSLIIETVQHFIGRSFDVDDIILNVVGGIIGFLLYTALSAIKNHLPKILQKDFIYNILSIAFLVIIALYIYKIF